MSKATEVIPSADELEQLYFGGERHYRLLPAFADGICEVEETKAVLRLLLDDPDLDTFTVDSRDEGAARLRRLADADARCSGFRGAADLALAGPVDRLVIVGWSLR